MHPWTWNATPVPAIAANDGHFKVYTPIGDTGNAGESLPPRFNGTADPGLFGVPLDDKPASQGIRAHEYGHLGLHSQKIVSDDAGEKLVSATNPLVMNSMLDVLVNDYMLSKGVTEIKNLPFPPSTNRRDIDATTYLRSLGVTKGLRFPVLSKQDKSAIRGFYKELRSLLRSGKVDTDKLTDVAKRFHEYTTTSSGSAPKPSTGEGGTGPDSSKRGESPSSSTPGDSSGFTPEKPKRQHRLKPIPASISKMMSGSELGKGTAYTALDYALDVSEHTIPIDYMEILKRYRGWEDDSVWADMRIVKHPIETPLARADKRGRRIKPGFAGAFRYPLRALLPAFDGSAFGVSQRSEGGTMLFDLSGSMSISVERLAEIVDKHPHVTIAGYNGGKPSRTIGTLFIIAQRGKRISDLALVKEGGVGNMVDGPALEWLAKQRSPRVWICDGVVTGVSDRPAPNLYHQALNIKQRAKIVQYLSIKDFLNKRPVSPDSLQEVL